jgi:hypothetical protein
MADNDSKGAQVRDVTERTRSYVHDLQQENERLRSLLAVSETERSRLGVEVTELRGRLESSPAPVDHEADDVLRLEEENRRYAERYVVLEQKNTELANLYVASYRLHETLSRTEVLAALQEIVVNLIGCEQHAVYELDSEGRLVLEASMGVDAVRCRQLTLGDDPVSRAIQAGVSFVSDGEPVKVASQPYPVSASVPLRLEGKPTGAVVLYHLLPQKPGIETVDRELFDLLAVHASTALYTTKLHQAVTGAPKT